MITNKIIGYTLLIVGLSLIIFTLYQSYNIFTDKYSAPSIFKVQTPLSPSKNNSGNSLQDLQKQLNQEISKQISQMVPADTLPKILNLFSWSILAGIFIFGGSQIAILGVKMIK